MEAVDPRDGFISRLPPKMEMYGRSHSILDAGRLYE